LFHCIRGTAGSGKTTAVKSIKRLYPKYSVIMKDKLGQQIINLCHGHQTLADCVIVGQYVEHTDKITTGGDSIYYTEQLKLAAKYVDSHGYDVIWEGIIHQSYPIFEELSRLSPVCVYYMDETEDTILKRRIKRSKSRGYDHQMTTATGIHFLDKLKSENLRIQELENVELIHTHSQLVKDLFVDRLQSRPTRPFEDEDLWDFKCRYDHIKSIRSKRREIVSDLFTYTD